MSANRRPASDSTTPSPTGPSPQSQAFRAGLPWLIGILALMVAAILYQTIIVKSDTPVVTGADLTTVLAPFLAVAVAIERFWQSVFDLYERFALATARFVGVTADAVGWITGEVRNAEKAVEEAAAALGDKTPADPEYKRLWDEFQEAEQRLQDAKTRIAETLKTPEYVAIKRSIILFGSFMLGLLISIPARLSLLRAAGLNVPTAADVIITGLLIGAGPGPLHSLIGVLQELRNAVAGLAELTSAGAIKRVSESFPKPTGPAPESRVTPTGGTLAAEAETATAAPAPVQFQTSSDNLRTSRQALRLLRRSR